MTEPLTGGRPLRFGDEANWGQTYDGGGDVRMS